MSGYQHTNGRIYHSSNNVHTVACTNKNCNWVGRRRKEPLSCGCPRCFSPVQITKTVMRKKS